MRVLVVDDSALFRRAVSEALTGLPEVEVVGVASNGKLAMGRLADLQPDLLTLDIEMPEMNGLEVLQALSSAKPRPGVILLSAHTVRGGQMTVRALELGAFDFVTKPESGSALENVARMREQLRPMVRAFQRQYDIRKTLRQDKALERSTQAASPGGAVRRGPPMVLIGVSTGGPQALAQLLPALPATLAAPVFIVQHMPPLFTEPLAASLGGKCKLRVFHASEGQRPEPGCVYLAPGGSHMKLARGPRGEIVIRITQDPPENNCRPSVDYLFRSAALEFPGRAVAVVLTGMGNDGAAGLRQLKRGGCLAIAQDEASCVVFGMPGEAIKTGAVDMVLPLSQIGAAIERSVVTGIAKEGGRPCY
jgi:two-component system chemotaxis response regulator CheB